MKEKTIIGVSGDIGSFSEQVGLRYAQKKFFTPQSFSLTYLIDMENVLAAVEAGTVDLGIFPVVNFQGGFVTMALTAMGAHYFTLVDDFWLDVQQCLLVYPSTKLDQIKKIVSHPQALAQCRKYLEKNFNNSEFIPWEDTAKAARDLQEGKLDQAITAVLAPEHAADIYHLAIMAKNIQDVHPNLTGFIIVKKRGK